MGKIKGPLKEGTIHAGDQIDQWIVDEEIGGDRHPCVYKVHHEETPNEYFAMKIREPNMEPYFQKELEILRRLNRDESHPSFQKLYSFSKERHKLYFVFDPYMPPDNNFFEFPPLELRTKFPAFLQNLIEALRWGAKHGVLLGKVSHEHLFIKDDGKTPFLLGLSDEPNQKKPVDTIDIDTGLIGAIGQRFVDAEKQRMKSVFRADSLISLSFK